MHVSLAPILILHELFFFPWGLGMGDPTKQITAPLKNLIISQVAHAHPPDTRSIRAQVQREASK